MIVTYQKSAKFDSKDQISAILRHQNQVKPNSYQKNVSPHGIMGKNMNPINLANSSSTIEVTLLKGIPHSIRPRAWLHLCGAKYRMSRQPGGFEQYVHEPGEQKWIDDIQKDLHRNFPNHEMFGGTYERIGQNELFKVLKAYTVHNPTEGYCQAQAPIAAALLMNMPATEAFWCLVCICENYIPGEP